MTSFNHEDIIRLFDAACTAGIVDIRDALMAGIDPAFVGTFPKSKTSASQLLMDLDRLNAAGELLDGSVPFAIWLNNADRLAGNRNEAQVFREYRDLIQGGGGTTSSERRLESVRNRRSPTLPPPSLVDRLSSWALSGFSLVVMALIAGIAVAKGKSWQVARAWGDYVQLVFVIVVFIATCVAVPRAPEGTGANASRCQSCIKQFTNNWQLLWLLWVVFYAIHSMRHLVQQLLWRAEAPPWWWAVGVPWLLNFMHNVQGVILLILFLTMVRPKAKASTDESNHHHLVGLVVCVLASMVEAFLLLSTQYDGGGVSVLRAAELWPALITGVFTATSLAMFVGTLESPFLDVGTGELIALYAYAAIQPLFRFTILGEFDKDLHDPAQIIDLVLKSFALALKLGLYFVVSRHLASGRLAFYMWKVQDPPATPPAEWQAFQRGPLADSGATPPTNVAVLR